MVNVLYRPVEFVRGACYAAQDGAVRGAKVGVKAFRITLPIAVLATLTEQKDAPYDEKSLLPTITTYAFCIIGSTALVGAVCSVARHTFVEHHDRRA